MKDLKREDIIEVLQDELEGIIDDVASDYNSSDNPQGEELEYKARSGYVPYIDGGYKYTFLSFAPQLEGSGIDLPTKVLQDKVEEYSKNADEHAQSLIWEDNKDEEFRDKFPTKEDVNYSDLEEFDSSYAEEFDEIVREYRDDESIMFSIEAMYYNPENDYAEDGKNTITLSGSVNLEAPYHRRGFYEDFKEITFTFSSLESLEKKLRNELDVIKMWFEGSDYKTSTTELKQGRLEKGGSLNWEENFKELNLNEEELEYVSKMVFMADGGIGEVIERKEKNPKDFKESVKRGVKISKGELYAKGGVPYSKRFFDIVEYSKDGTIVRKIENKNTYEAEDIAFKLNNTNPVRSGYHYVKMEERFAKGGKTNQYYEISFTFEDEAEQSIGGYASNEQEAKELAKKWVKERGYSNLMNVEAQVVEPPRDYEDDEWQLKAEQPFPYYAKGGMTGYNKFFDKFKRSDAYISEPRKTAKGNYIVEVDPHDKETSKQMKDYMQSEGIGYSPKPMGKGFYTQFAKGGSIKSVWELKERLEFALGDKDYVDSEIAKNNGEVVGLYNTFRDRLIEIGDDEYVRANDEFHAHSSNKLGDDGHGYYSKGGMVDKIIGIAKTQANSTHTETYVYPISADVPSKFYNEVGFKLENKNDTVRVVEIQFDTKKIVLQGYDDEGENYDDVEVYKIDSLSEGFQKWIAKNLIMKTRREKGKTKSYFNSYAKGGYIRLSNNNVDEIEKELEKILDTKVISDTNDIDASEFYIENGEFVVGVSKEKNYSFSIYRDGRSPIDSGKAKTFDELLNKISFSAKKHKKSLLEKQVYAKGGGVSTLKTEYIKFLKDNGVDVDRLKFRHIKSGPYGDEEVWTHPKSGGGSYSGVVMTRDHFEELKKDNKDYSIESFISTTYAKGGMIEAKDNFKYTLERLNPAQKKLYKKELERVKEKGTEHLTDRDIAEYINGWYGEDVVTPYDISGKQAFDFGFKVIALEGVQKENEFWELGENYAKGGLLMYDEIDRIDDVSGIHNRYVVLSDGRMKFTPITKDSEILEIMKKANIPSDKKEEVSKYLNFEEISSVDEEGNTYAKGGELKSIMSKKDIGVVIPKTYQIGDKEFGNTYKVERVNTKKYSANDENRHYNFRIWEYDKSLDLFDEIKSPSGKLKALERIEMSEDYAKGGVIIVSDEDGGEERVKGRIKVKIVDNLDEHRGYKEGEVLNVEEIDGDDYMITKEGAYLSYAEVDFADKESQDVYSNIMNKRYDYAKGGEVKKKGNEMLIGGLAGVLLGIFFNK